VQKRRRKPLASFSTGREAEVSRTLQEQAVTKNRMKPTDLAAHIGQEFAVSSWITVDQARIDEFAHCTGDNQWIHIDLARAAKDSPFGVTIAHGFLTLSLVAPTSFETMISKLEVKQALNYGLEKVRFLAPVRAGKRVRNRIKIAALEDKGNGRTLLTTENTIEIESEVKPAAIAFAQVMLVS
jgi:acyl dehydratase